MDSVNSTTFIKRPPLMTEAQECILYTKEILSGQLFLGSYQERRYVPVLNEYRDVVVVSSEEKQLHYEIDKVRRKWLPVSGIKWVGITGPDTLTGPKAYCFWVKFLNLPFGYYWFQIKHVKLVEVEVLLQLKCIRKCQPSDSAVFSNHNHSDLNTSKNEMSDSPTKGNPSLENQSWDLQKTFSSFYKNSNDIIHNIQPLITWRNLFIFLKTGLALILALILASISCVRYIGEYVLRLIHVLAILVNAFSPIIVQIIDFFTKVVGGLFILIAGMFRVNAPRPFIEPRAGNKYRSIPYSELSRTPEQNVDWRVRNRILRQELLLKR